jgi:hypothetical protein
MSIDQQLSEKGFSSIHLEVLVRQRKVGATGLMGQASTLPKIIPYGANRSCSGSRVFSSPLGALALRFHGLTCLTDVQLLSLAVIETCARYRELPFRVLVGTLAGSPPAKKNSKICSNEANCKLQSQKPECGSRIVWRKSNGPRIDRAVDGLQLANNTEQPMFESCTRSLGV